MNYNNCAKREEEEAEDEEERKKFKWGRIFFFYYEHHFSNQRLQLPTVFTASICRRRRRCHRCVNDKRHHLFTDTLCFANCIFLFSLSQATDAEQTEERDGTGIESTKRNRLLLTERFVYVSLFCSCALSFRFTRQTCTDPHCKLTIVGFIIIIIIIIIGIYSSLRLHYYSCFIIESTKLENNFTFILTVIINIIIIIIIIIIDSFLSH